MKTDLLSYKIVGHQEPPVSLKSAIEHFKKTHVNQLLLTGQPRFLYLQSDGIIELERLGYNTCGIEEAKLRALSRMEYEKKMKAEFIKNSKKVLGSYNYVRP